MPYFFALADKRLGDQPHISWVLAVSWSFLGSKKSVREAFECRMRLWVRIITDYYDYLPPVDLSEGQSQFLRTPVAPGQCSSW